MRELIQLLKEGKHSCVVKNIYIQTCNSSGITDILNLLKKEPDFLYGSKIADKIVGKAAASILIVGGVKEVYAETISESAIALFTQHKINVTYHTRVPYIKNRTQTDWCPLENLCKEIDNPTKAVSSIESFIEQMREKK